MATTEMNVKRITRTDHLLSPPEPSGSDEGTNVSGLERTVSVLAGSAVTLYGLRRGGASGLLVSLLGGAALKRGLSGRCDVYAALGVSTAEEGAGRGQGLSLGARRTIDMSAAATVRNSADELYRLWKDPQNLTRFMTFLDRVEQISDTRARWWLNAPVGPVLEFEAEVIDDVAGERIAWRAVEGAMIEHTGEVEFRPAPADRGTEVRLTLHFRPPGGAVGAALLRLFDGAAELKLRGDLKRFKQWVETGEVATTEGQPSGRA
jgi:uncharacterized membrane protein